MAFQQLKDDPEYFNNIVSIIAHQETQLGTQCRNISGDFCCSIPKFTLPKDKINPQRPEDTKFPIPGNQNILFNSETYKVITNILFDENQAKLAKISQLFINFDKLSPEYYDKNQDLYYHQIQENIYQQAELGGHPKKSLSDFDNLNTASKELGKQCLIKLLINCIICVLQYTHNIQQLLLTQTFRQILSTEQRSDQNGKKYNVDYYKITEILNAPYDQETLDNCFFIVFLKNISEYVEYDYNNNPECTQEIYQLICNFIKVVIPIKDALITYIHNCQVPQDIITQFSDTCTSLIHSIIKRSGVYFNYSYQNLIIKDLNTYNVSNETTFLIEQFLSDKSERKKMLVNFGIKCLNQFDFDFVVGNLLEEFQIDYEADISNVLERQISQDKIVCLIPVIRSEYQHQVGFQHRYLQSAIEYILMLKQSDDKVLRDKFEQHKQRLIDRNTQELVYQQILKCQKLLKLDNQKLNGEFLLFLIDSVITYVNDGQHKQFSQEIIDDIEQVANQIDFIPENKQQQTIQQIYIQICSLAHIYNLLQEVFDKDERINIQQKLPLMEQFYVGQYNKFINDDDLIQMSYQLKESRNKDLEFVQQMHTDGSWYLKTIKVTENSLDQDISQEIKDNLSDRQLYLTSWIKYDKFYQLLDVCKVQKSGNYYKQITEWKFQTKQENLIYAILTKDATVICQLDDNTIPYLTCDDLQNIYIDQNSQPQEDPIKVINILKGKHYICGQDEIPDDVININQIQENKNNNEIQEQKEKEQNINEQQNIDNISEQQIVQECQTLNEFTKYIKTQHRAIKTAITYFGHRDQIHKNVKLFYINNISDELLNWSQQNTTNLFIFCQERNKTIGESLYNRFKQIKSGWNEDSKNKLLNNDKEEVTLALQHFNIIIVQDQITINNLQVKYINYNNNKYIIYTK